MVEHLVINRPLHLSMSSNPSENSSHIIKYNVNTSGIDCFPLQFYCTCREKKEAGHMIYDVKKGDTEKYLHNRKASEFTFGFDCSPSEGKGKSFKAQYIYSIIRGGSHGRAS